MVVVVVVVVVVVGVVVAVAERSHDLGDMTRIHRRHEHNILQCKSDARLALLMSCVVCCVM